MPFNFKLLFQVLYKSLCAPWGTLTRRTLARIILILFLYPSYVLLELINWFFFIMDSIFFRSYRQIEVREPVFIVGNARSGTTFLQRLVAQDKGRFTSMKFWEIIFAPTISQKKLFLALGRLDKSVGGPFYKIIRKVESCMFEGYNKMHKTSLFEYEEDEFLLFHIFSSVWLLFIFPFEDCFNPLARFDIDLPKKDRTQIMAFYKRCVQNHLFVFGKDKILLSKNPTFSSKIESLQETFPGAKIICMIRSPLEVIPSNFSLATYVFKFFASHLDQHPLIRFTDNTITHWYHYPVEKIAVLDKNLGKVINYNNLVENPDQTVTDLYKHFSFDMSPQFQEILIKENSKTRKYNSKHTYSLEELGLSKEHIIDTHSDIFEQFGFDTENSSDA